MAKFLADNAFFLAVIVVTIIVLHASDNLAGVTVDDLIRAMQDIALIVS